MISKSIMSPARGNDFSSAYRRPHVVVIGNHEGGTGEVDCCHPYRVAPVKCGCRVATFDLDLQRQPLTRFIRNRRDCARQNGDALEVPTHAPIVVAEIDWDRG